MRRLGARPSAVLCYACLTPQEQIHASSRDPHQGCDLGLGFASFFIGGLEKETGANLGQGRSSKNMIHRDEGN
jgi:hypothetical protein